MSFFKPDDFRGMITATEKSSLRNIADRANAKRDEAMKDANVIIKFAAQHGDSFLRYDSKEWLKKFGSEK